MNINYNDWVRDNRRYLDASLKFMLSSMARSPYLELSTQDGDAYTDGARVHVGVKKLNADTEDELMTMVLFRLGHEAQHCLSTTDKAWKYGIMTGYHVVCEALSKRIEPKPRRFIKETDYDRFLSDLANTYNIYVSKDTIIRLSHFICNSVEEMANDADQVRTHILLVLNQVLTLATMGIYQKGFAALAAKYPDTHKLVQKLIPEISAGVYARTCREGMKHAVEITKILADEIAEAATLTDIEKILSELLSAVITIMSYPADSQSEQTGQTTRDGDASGVTYFDGSVISNDLENGDTTSSKDKEDTDAKDSPLNSPENAEAADVRHNCSPEALDNKLSSGDSSMEDERSIEERIKEAMSQAGDALEEEVRRAEEAGYRNKKDLPSNPVSKKGEDYIPEGDKIEGYPYEVVFTEQERDYVPNDRMPSDLASQANILKRKVEKIFRNMEQPALRAQTKGRIDAGRLYKAAMGELDFFAKKQIVPESEWCAYFLCDNSGSMGNGIGSKRYHACTALAVIEHAFQEIMPLKITAFDADGYQDVRHQVIKNWSETLHYNGAYNFYTKGCCGWGNKDGFSIRIATQELMARPERKKLLIVLSDGLPSNYNGSPTGKDDVRSAVDIAIRSGISVISIYFGGDYEDVTRTFAWMYGENRSIVCDPDRLTEQLSKKMKQFCFRR